MAFDDNLGKEFLENGCSSDYTLTVYTDTSRSNLWPLMNDFGDTYNIKISAYSYPSIGIEDLFFRLAVPRPNTSRNYNYTIFFQKDYDFASNNLNQTFEGFPLVKDDTFSFNFDDIEAWLDEGFGDVDDEDLIDAFFDLNADELY